MRKLGISLFSCMALVVFMGLSAPAFAATDPDCVPNDFAVTNFSVDTTGSDLEHSVSAVTGQGRACGSEISDGALFDPDDFPGLDSLNDIAVIENPPGVEVSPAPSAALPVGSYVGSAQIDVLSWVYLFWANRAVFADATEPVVVMRVDDPAGIDVDCPDDALACYKGVEDTVLLDGHGWVWVEDVGAGRTALTIGPFYNDTAVGKPAGLTEIDDFDLCAWAGAVAPQGTPGSCGDPESEPTPGWVQKNGDASYPNCDNGKGIYSVTVTNKGGATTDPATACVEWTTPPPTPKPCKEGSGGLGGPESMLKQCIRAQRLPDPR